MGKTSTATKNAWNAKAYDQLRVIVKKGQKEQIAEHAASKGMSLNAYINALIAADMGEKLTKPEQEQGEYLPCSFLMPLQLPSETHTPSPAASAPADILQQFETTQTNLNPKTGKTNGHPEALRFHCRNDLLTSIR